MKRLKSSKGNKKLISIMEIIAAIEREDMVEAHRLVRERKARKAQIEAELDALAPQVMQRNVNRENYDRAMSLLHQGQIEEAKALLEEHMTSEELKFGHLLLELMGLDVPNKDIPTNSDLADTQAMINEAFKVG